MTMGSVALSSATHTGHDFGCCLHPAPGSGPVLTGHSQELTFSHHLFEVWNSHEVFNNSHELSQSTSDCLGIHFLFAVMVSDETEQTVTKAMEMVKQVFACWCLLWQWTISWTISLYDWWQYCWTFSSLYHMAICTHPSLYLSFPAKEMDMTLWR